MPKRGSDADNRIFFDELASLAASRLRATGAIRLQDRHGVIAFGEETKACRRRPYGFPQWRLVDLFRLSEVRRQEKKLWLIEDAPRCLSRCWPEVCVSLGLRLRLDPSV